MTAVAVLSPEQLRAMLEEAAERGAERALARGAVAPTDWATPEQAAALLGATPKTVRRWAASGRLRATREGSRWKIDRASLPEVKPASPEDHARAALVALPGRR
jgi:excisionase family DNA binding protein